MSSVVAGCVNVSGAGSSSAAAAAVGVGSGGGTSLFVDVGMLLIEGRVAEQGTPRGYKEGPHCPLISNSPTHHICQDSLFLCERASKLRRHMSLLNENSAPMCIDVLLCPDCGCGQNRANSTNICQIPSSADLLIEQWTVSVVNHKNICLAGNSSNISGTNSISNGINSAGSNQVSDRVLLQALRSQLHFSQLSAWYSLGKVRHVCYRLSHPVGCSGFTRPPVQHNFPLAKISQNTSIKVCLKSLPRTDVMPVVSCPVHSGQSTLNATVTVFKSVFAELGQCLLDPPARIPAVRHGFTMWRDSKAASPTRRQRQSPPLASKVNTCSTHTPGVLDDRMLSGCKHIGKHHCEDDEPCGLGVGDEKVPRHNKAHHVDYHLQQHHHHQLHRQPSYLELECSSGYPKEASGSSKYNPFDLGQPRVHDVFNVYRCETYNHPLLDISGEQCYPSQQCSKDYKDTHSASASSSCASSKAELLLSALIARGSKVNPLKRKWVTSATTTSSEGSSKKLVSSAATKATELAEYFTRLDISHHEDSLPPPPLPPPLPPPPRTNAPLAIPQRGTQCWGTDSSSEETEGESPVNVNRHKSATNHRLVFPPSSLSATARLPSSPIHRPIGHNSRPLLGSFEENILSGRIRPVSKVDGFTADLGASGNFCPQHLKLPVSVSFFAVEPNSAPYLGEINLGKKGYTVPRNGTIQLTLLNPLGTVIKIFVVAYDVTDMPANSHTFIRQRTVSTEPPHANKLRYLIHLRLRSSKSGRVSLMSDIQVILSRQYDVDSSIGLDFETGCLKSVTITPSSPRYSANK